MRKEERRCARKEKNFSEKAAKKFSCFFLSQFVLLLFLLSFLQGCDFDKYKSKATIGEMTLTSDENIEPLIKQEVSEFERLNTESKIQVLIEPTKNAFADLINGQSKIIVVTRDFTTEELEILKKYKIEVQKFKFGIEGIAFVVNPKNPLLRITSEELIKILNGQIAKWSQLKTQDQTENKQITSYFTGTKDKIQLYIQRKNSYTYDYVKDSILNGLNYINTAVICSTSAQIMNNVRKEENSIGILSSAWLSTGNQDVIDSTVKALRISKIWSNGRQDDYAQFHQGLIYNKQYPYRRDLYAITTQLDIGLQTGFITFLLNKDGQKVVLKNGIVPVTQPVTTIQIK
jgi:phosphate transport system substrate-binding protein